MNSVKTVKCLVPFTQFYANTGGECYSCCYDWTILGNAGWLKNNTIMDLWNGKKMQFIRKAILENKLEKVCNFKYCPVAKKNEIIKVDWPWGDDHFKAIIEQIHQGKTILETAPYIIGTASSGKCNLRCTMCVSHEDILKPDEKFDELFYTKYLPEILPKLSRLQLAGNGEVLFNKNSRRFLQNLDASKYPSLKIKLITNANLFTPKIWETIKHNNFEEIIVSIDAARKDTYEKIRINGKWEVLLDNLIFISELRQQGRFNNYTISYVVLRSNYEEIKEFVQLGIDLSVDRILFQKVYGTASIKENFNLGQNIEIKKKIGEILEDPIFRRPEVDTILIDEYRQPLVPSEKILDKVLSKLKFNLT